MVGEPNSLNDARSDEALILALYNGENAILDIIYYRYIKYLRFFLLKASWLKDDSSIDDIIQETLLVLLQNLHIKKFKPEGEGSFRAWLCSIARNVAMNYNRSKGRQPLNISQQLLETAPDDPVVPEIERKEEERERKKKLNKILSKLSPDEKDLLFQLSQGKTYKQIHEMSEFNKSSIDYLMRKVYLIRKKLKE